MKVRITTAERKIAICRLRGSHFREYKDAGYIDTVSNIKGVCRLFSVPEIAKERFRIICWTLSINSALSIMDEERFSLPNIEEVVATLESPKITHVISLDMRSWFNQFPLHDDIRRFMAFKRNGNWYAPTRMPMGMRHSCLVAQVAIDILVARGRTLCQKVFTYLDNVLILGSELEVRSALLAILQDFDECSATVNDRIALDALANGTSIPTAQDFCGVRLDYTNRTAKVLEKTINKLNRIWEAKENWSFRGATSFCSTALFCTRVLKIPRDLIWNQMRMWSNLSKKVGQDSWDELAPWSSPDWKTLEVWFDLIHENQKIGARISTDSFPETEFIISDASAEQRAGIHVKYNQPNIVEVNTGPSMSKSKSSSVTEPWAVFHAAKALLDQIDKTKRTVRVFCDNSGFVLSAKKGYSGSWHHNRVITLIRQVFLNSLHASGPFGPTLRSQHSARPNP